MDLKTLLIHPDELPVYVEMFHMFGHGIQNGVPEEEHLRRVLNETEGLMGMVLYKNDIPVACATLWPSLLEDSHFLGAGLVVVHLAGSDVGTAGMRELHRGLRRLAKQEGASWYSVSSRVSLYEYRNRYYMLGD